MRAPLPSRLLLVLALLLAQWGAYAHALDHATLEPHACALCVHGKHDSSAPVSDASAPVPLFEAAAPVFDARVAAPTPGACPAPPIRDPPAAPQG